MVMNHPYELSYGKCRELLGAGVFGRVGVCTAQKPVILPVNYALVGEAIIFRTTPYGVVAHHDWDSLIAFEVDHVDYADHKGWSVLATGRAERIADPDEIDRIKRTWEPQPWAGGDRPLYVKLAWEELTGRRLGQGWTHANETPVRRHL
jgi:nitroimidazol reductase NimA-like FMN-containing flavoprotein (pyridoxamine 5'-phosphate oxidase superfamily)